jgi:hypothetical protein
LDSNRKGCSLLLGQAALPPSTAHPTFTSLCLSSPDKRKHQVNNQTNRKEDRARECDDLPSASMKILFFLIG